MYKIRIPVGTLLVLIVVGIFYLDYSKLVPNLCNFLILLCIIRAIWELYRLLENRGYRPYSYYGLAIVGIGLLIALCISTYPGNNWGSIVHAYFTMAVIGLLLLAFRDCQHPYITEKISCTLLGISCSYLLSYLLLLRFLDMQYGLVYLLMVLLVSKSTDIGGYLLGKLLGKHLLAPKISPQKTWEGFLGGMLLAIGTALLLRLQFTVLAQKLSIFYTILLAILLGISSPLGDLWESIIKRHCNAKDSYSLIPEFGGLLDLLDSLMFSAPLAYYFLYLTMAPVRL